jgi:UDP-2,3-diacylglucosamine pyrophosphatase LpxH
MRRVKIVVNDFHIGKGVLHQDGTVNILEDFRHGRAFVEFLEYYRSGDFAGAEVELIINGDFLNLIQIPIGKVHPKLITEKVSVAKLKMIIDGHKDVFDALKKFNEGKDHSLSYVVGNHDLEMLWAGTRKLFTERVGGRVQFYNTTYISDGVHIEHGHQLEATNRVDPKRIYITEDVPEPILNLPWGSHFLLNVILKIKHSRPIIDSVRPVHMLIFWCILTDFWFGLWMAYQILSYFVKTRFVDLPYFSRFKTTLAVFKDMSVNFDVDRSAEKILRHHEGIHTVIFGHSHLCRYRQMSREKIYINTGTWNEITSLDLSSFGRSLKCTYAYLEYDTTRPDQYPQRKLKQWKGRWLPEDETFG